MIARIGEFKASGKLESSDETRESRAACVECRRAQEDNNAARALTVRNARDHWQKKIERKAKNEEEKKTHSVPPKRYKHNEAPGLPKRFPYSLHFKNSATDGAATSRNGNDEAQVHSRCCDLIWSGKTFSRYNRSDRFAYR
ncbi:hypothetical protein NDU88_004817 [Pleurodeles waltl]|uniref:Uncharacterized protein n=1 Tax=Pleurodeles waltl TaxID=8319 RepID=A0AAV7NKX1_PLEWA|nr:hypothetical protein NDU88_004817 [Pleurodeles waltl]